MVIQQVREEAAGDGCLAAPFVQYATTDAEMIERLRPLLPAGVQLRFVAKCSWNMTAQTPRNPLIAQVFFRRGLIEQWGRGTQNIVDWCVAAGQPEPDSVAP